MIHDASIRMGRPALDSIPTVTRMAALEAAAALARLTEELRQRIEGEEDQSSEGAPESR